MGWDSNIDDAPEGALRDQPPDLRSPIDPEAPVGGHHPPAETNPIHDTPEHDWSVAATLVVPMLRPAGSHGTRLAEVDREQLAREGLRGHALPVVDDGPEGLTIAYAIRAGGFDVLVNADHLLEWRIEPTTLRSTAMANLATWSAAIAWVEEAEGTRRLVSSDSGDGSDATRILLPEVRSYLATRLGHEGRVLVGLPERHLLVAGTLRGDDVQFATLFADFVGARAEGADEPIDRRLFELVRGDLVAFTV
ncbi:MAG TPA: hypothetical protein VF494_12210 [Candidatus Limnocylindrales bacterium]